MAPAPKVDPPEVREQRRKTIEEWGWQLLRRWGVMFKDLLVREQGAPAWWELVQHYRRLEARGEIRGGRFIQGVGGEQFALPDTVRALRDLKDGKLSGDQRQPMGVTISGADPLNLVGILTSQPRVPSTAGNKVLYWNGRPAACLIGGEVTLYPECPAEAAAAARQRFELSRPIESVMLQEVEGAAALSTGATSRTAVEPVVEKLTAEAPTEASGKSPEQTRKRVPARVVLGRSDRTGRYPSGAPRPRFS